jgi:hypothetical protein
MLVLLKDYTQVVSPILLRIDEGPAENQCAKNNFVGIVQKA